MARALAGHQDVLFVGDVFIPGDPAAHGEFGGFPQFVDAFQPFEQEQPEHGETDGHSQPEEGAVPHRFGLVGSGDADAP